MAYKQAKARHKRLLKTYEATKHSYGSGVWYNETKGFYHKYTASNTPGYTKTLKRLSNKKVRQSKDIGNHNSYRRKYDYYWVLF